MESISAQFQFKKKEMVPITTIYDYRHYLENKPKLLAFSQLINGQTVTLLDQSNMTETDQVFFTLLNAFAANKKDDFETTYSQFSRRKPSVDSAWIHTDIFVFLLVTGVVTYNLDKAWLYGVLAVRPNANPINQVLNKTLFNIANEAYEHDDNNYAIIIVFLSISNKTQLPNALLNEALKVIRNSNIMDSNNDFLIMTTLRAYELIIESKQAVDSAEFIFLKTFKLKFEKRALLLSQIIYFVIISIIIYAIIHFMRNYSGFKDYVSDIGAVFQLLGVSMVVSVKWVMRFIEKVVLACFGYPSKSER